MQRVAGQYVVKRFADQLLGPQEQGEQQRPQPGADQALYSPAAQQTAQGQQPAPVQSQGGELDGTMIYDDDGNRLGVARHVRGVSVYLVSHAANELNRRLQQTVTSDPEMELRLATDATGNLTGLIYVPASARAAQNIAGTRADDV